MLRMRRRWRSLKTMTRSKQSRRTLPIRRSTNGFCQGLRGALRTCSMPHALYATPKALAVDRIAIPREGLDDLLGRPLRRRFSVTLKWTTRRLSCASTSMTKNTLKPTVGHGEEIDRYEFRHVVLQERSPCRGGWLAVANAILLHRGFRHLNAELAQFAQDAW